MRATGWILIGLLAAEGLSGQRAKNSARDLFYAEAGLVVPPGGAGRGRFGSARKSTVALTLGLKWRVWKLAGTDASEADPEGRFDPGQHIRLGVETNDAGYLYIVHRQPGGNWRRLFPTSEIEGGNHFIRSGLTYPIPPEESVELQFPGGSDRFLVVLSRSPVKELEVLVLPRQPEGTVSAAPTPEVSEAVVDRVRNLVPHKELLSQREESERVVYVVNRGGKPDAAIVAEIRLSGR